MSFMSSSTLDSPQPTAQGLFPGHSSLFLHHFQVSRVKKKHWGGEGASPSSNCPADKHQIKGIFHGLFDLLITTFSTLSWLCLGPAALPSNSLASFCFK